MNRKLTFLGIALWIVMTLTGCIYYSGGGYYHRDYDRHGHPHGQGQYDHDHHGWDRHHR